MFLLKRFMDPPEFLMQTLLQENTAWATSLWKRGKNEFILIHVKFILFFSQWLSS